MGTTFFNYHVRTESVEAVCAALERTKSVAWVAAEPWNGWVSVYPYRCDDAELSQALKLPLIHLNLYDNDVASYRLFENGDLVDEYDSIPDYWAGQPDENGDELQPKTPEELAYFAPSPEKLLPYCLPEFTLADVQGAFRKSKREAFERIEAFQREHNPDFDSSNLPDFRDLPGIDRPDAFSVIMELFRLLGLNERFLYSGYERVVIEEDFSLLVVSKELLSKEDLSRLLLESIPDVRVISTSGKSISENPQKNISAMKLWLESGADPNRTGYPDGYPAPPPLFSAVTGSCIEAIQILLDAGADPNASFTYRSHSLNGEKDWVMTPLFMAKQSSYPEEIAALLKAYGAVETQ